MRTSSRNGKRTSRIFKPYTLDITQSDRQRKRDGAEQRQDITKLDREREIDREFEHNRGETQHN